MEALLAGKDAWAGKLKIDVRALLTDYAPGTPVAGEIAGYRQRGQTDHLDELTERLVRLLAGPETGVLIAQKQLSLAAFEALCGDLPGDHRERLQEALGGNPTATGLIDVTPAALIQNYPGSAVEKKILAWRANPLHYHRLGLAVTALRAHLERQAKVAEVKKSNVVRACLGHLLPQLPEHWALELVETLKRLGITPIRPHMSRSAKASSRAFLDGFVRDPAFLRRYPYYAAVLARLSPVADPSIARMAVSLFDGRFYLHVNVESFVAEPQYLRGVLLHEVHHVVLGHLSHPKFTGAAEPELMDLALEMSANEYIEEPLPDPIIVARVHRRRRPRRAEHDGALREARRGAARRSVQGQAGARHRAGASRRSPLAATGRAPAGRRGADAADPKRPPRTRARRCSRTGIRRATSWPARPQGGWSRS